MTDAKRKRASSTISFDVNSEDALKAHDYLASFGRRQGRFITALILFYLQHQDRLFYSAESGKIWDLKAIVPYMNKLGYSYDDDPKQAISLVERIESLDKDMIELVGRIVSSNKEEIVSPNISGDNLSNDVFDTFPEKIQSTNSNVVVANGNASNETARSNTIAQPSSQILASNSSKSDIVTAKPMLSDDDDDDEDVGFFTQMSFH